MRLRIVLIGGGVYEVQERSPMRVIPFLWYWRNRGGYSSVTAAEGRMEQLLADYRRGLVKPRVIREVRA